ncbi:hypothetical protein AB0O47_32780 [Streptomyces noursei]|uniref:hypothetical protein n=1 Tax=Streptomyces noursei TaxID=1971 RepID=UPI0034510ECD
MRQIFENPVSDPFDVPELSDEEIELRLSKVKAGICGSKREDSNATRKTSMDVIANYEQSSEELISRLRELLTIIEEFELINDRLQGESSAESEVEWFLPDRNSTANSSQGRRFQYDLHLAKQTEGEMQESAMPNLALLAGARTAEEKAFPASYLSEGFDPPTTLVVWMVKDSTAPGYDDETSWESAIREVPLVHRDIKPIEWERGPRLLALVEFDFPLSPTGGVSWPKHPHSPARPPSLCRRCRASTVELPPPAAAVVIDGTQLFRSSAFANLGMSFGMFLDLPQDLIPNPGNLTQVKEFWRTKWRTELRARIEEIQGTHTARPSKP